MLTLTWVLSVRQRFVVIESFLLICFCQEEEDGSDEDPMSSLTAQELPVPPPRRTTRAAVGEEDSDRDSDPAFVSPLDEVKSVHQQPVLTTANLHEASRSVRRALSSPVGFWVGTWEL